MKQLPLCTSKFIQIPLNVFKTPLLMQMLWLKTVMIVLCLLIILTQRLTVLIVYGYCWAVSLFSLCEPDLLHLRLGHVDQEVLRIFYLKI